MGNKPVGRSARLNLWLVDGADDEFAELCDVLREAGVEGVQRPLLADPVPGFRGADGQIADVVATMEPTVGLLKRIFGVLRNWLAARPQRTIELRIGEECIKINGLSSANEDRLVEAFVRRISEGK
jgi:hypothetical protein